MWATVNIEDLERDTNIRARIMKCFVVSGKAWNVFAVSLLFIHAAPLRYSDRTRFEMKDELIDLGDDFTETSLVATKFTQLDSHVLQVTLHRNAKENINRRGLDLQYNSARTGT